MYERTPYFGGREDLSSKAIRMNMPGDCSAVSCSGTGAGGVREEPSLTEKLNKVGMTLMCVLYLGFELIMFLYSICWNLSRIVWIKCNFL